MTDTIAPTSLPTPAPHVSPETKPFWSAAKDGRLVLPFCNACGTAIWYPKAFCSACGSFDVDWRDASGLATVYSYSQVYRGEGAYRDAGSFVLALVDLNEGPRVLTNIVGIDPADIAIGQRVQVVFHAAGDEAALPRFAPIPPDGPAAAVSTTSSQKEN